MSLGLAATACSSVVRSGRLLAAGCWLSERLVAQGFGPAEEQPSRAALHEIGLMKPLTTTSANSVAAIMARCRLSSPSYRTPRRSVPVHADHSSTPYGRRTAHDSRRLRSAGSP